MNNLNLKYPQEEIKYSMALGDESFLKRIEKYISSYGKDREIQVTHAVFQSTPEKIILFSARIASKGMTICGM